MTKERAEFERRILGRILLMLEDMRVDGHMTDATSAVRKAMALRGAEALQAAADSAGTRKDAQQ